MLCQAELFTHAHTKVLRVFRMAVTGLKFILKPGRVKPNGQSRRTPYDQYNYGNEAEKHPE